MYSCNHDGSKCAYTSKHVQKPELALFSGLPRFTYFGLLSTEVEEQQKRAGKAWEHLSCDIDT